MTSGRQTPVDDTTGVHAAYVQKANSLVQAGREDLAEELSATFAADTDASGAGSPPPSHDRRVAGRRSPTRDRSGRRPGATSRLGRLTRTSLSRLDRYTLDVFNPPSPYRENRSA